ncbi:hypothetical protein MJ585_10680 [Klebsiella pneumoniae]|nr:hypothetical protein MJ585_10680 [Klebsiella pneumoniae]
MPLAAPGEQGRQPARLVVLQFFQIPKMARLISQCGVRVNTAWRRIGRAWVGCVVKLNTWQVVPMLKTPVIYQGPMRLHGNIHYVATLCNLTLWLVTEAVKWLTSKNNPKIAEI